MFCEGLFPSGLSSGNCILVVRYIESKQVMKVTGVCQGRVGSFEVLIATELLK